MLLQYSIWLESGKCTCICHLEVVSGSLLSVTSLQLHVVFVRVPHKMKHNNKCLCLLCCSTSRPDSLCDVIERRHPVMVSSLMSWHEIGLLSYRIEDSRYVSKTGHRWVLSTKGRNTGGWRKLRDECHHHHHHQKHQGLDQFYPFHHQLQLFLPTFLWSSNCSPSLWPVVVWFQRDLVLWHSLQV